MNCQFGSADRLGRPHPYLRRKMGSAPSAPRSVLPTLPPVLIQLSLPFLFRRGFQSDSTKQQPICSLSMMNGLWVRTEYNSDQILARATTRLKWIGVQHAPFQGVCYGRHAKGHGMYYSGARARVRA